MPDDEPKTEEATASDDSSTSKNLAGLWSAVGPHAWGLLLHIVPHTPQLLVRLLDLGLRVVPKRQHDEKEE